ncbi:hypothetical protein F5Y12DRAFT_799466 [Xylaria sp. FL1777]|nr:hypothetical protein F5Y12DRAFT_799466 [Xylaria sp. FL1777]
MASMNGRSNTNEQLPRCASVSPMPTHQWQPGDIAFLKQAEKFSQTERTDFLDSGRIRYNATGHPVIILGRSSDQRDYIVTTVSAYSSGEYNNYLPPWKQEFHKGKDINGFRAFEGSAKPNNNFQHLYLADGKVWPKFRTSWVYIHHTPVVPASTLISYDKARSQLRITPESLQDLLGHMKARSRDFRGRGTATNAKREIKERVVKNFQQNWRHDDKENRQPLPNNRGQGPNTTGSKPLWSTIAAKSTSTANNKTCKVELNSQTHQNRYAILA